MKKGFSLILIVALLLTFSITDKVTVKAATTVTVYPETQFQTIEGWGTSLAWWGNAIGLWSDSNKKNEIMDLLFDPSSGIGLNVVRYNIGGGENPDHEHMRDKAEIEGYQPSPGVWDWSADASQRWVLQAAKSRGANIFEAFSNSPPYWMTYSQCAAGSDDGSNNLMEAYYDDFAEYIAEVAKHFNDNWGITFDTVTPLNEPVSTWWKSSNNQEGCHFDRDKQNQIIKEVAARLEAKGLSNIQLSAPEEYSIDDSIISYDSYDDTAKSSISQINTHTYGGSNRLGLRVVAEAADKKLWVSEVGVGGTASHDHNDMTSVIQLSDKIRTDLKYLQPDAWVYWQVVEDEAGQNNWGLIHANFSGTEEYWVTKQYYGMGNYSKFIRPGYKIIDIDNPNVLAAYDSTSGKLVLVTTNSGSSDVSYTYDLTHFDNLGSSAVPYRTSETESLEQLSEISISNKHLTATAKANSVTTYVISNVTYSGSTGYDRDTYYKIINKQSGKALDVLDGSKLDGADVIQWEYWGGDNQQWKLLPAGDGYYYIINKKSAKLVDVNGASADNGADVIQWQSNDGDNQKWSIISVGGGYYKIINKNSGKALDILDGSTLDGADAIQWEYWGGDNQQWSIVEIQ